MQAGVVLKDVCSGDVPPSRKGVERQTAAELEYGKTPTSFNHVIHVICRLSYQFGVDNNAV